jgi:hypothetical protein
MGMALKCNSANQIKSNLSFSVQSYLKIVRASVKVYASQNKRTFKSMIQSILSKTPRLVWFILFVGGIYSFNYLKDLYDANQLEERLKTGKVNNLIEKCLVRPYRKIKEFESTFEMELELSSKERTRQFFSYSERSDSNSVLDADNMQQWFDKDVELNVAELKKWTEKSRKYTTWLYDAYREYCIMEEACGDGRYGEYSSCMRQGPIWSNSEWQYPILWSLSD